MQAAPTTQQPFWNYVPFQTTSAGLGDDPAEWLPTLLAAGFTTADFATPASAKAACEGKGGTYVVADTVQSTVAAWSAGVTEPLQEEIEALKTQGTTAVSANTTLTAQVTSLTAELATANSRIAALVLDATPIKLAVGGAKGSSVAVGVTAAPLKTVTVTVSIPEAKARRLKLASSVLGKQTVTTRADGSASVTVKVSKAAAKSLKGSHTITVQAKSGDRFATTTSKLAR
ncbi:hypothetical protein [Solirubrobacter soli]|uniref:hypothetical protein n=1 Tax=Solirubrobacter soli TaxID=363832 RepID=UPI0003FF751F|nr:hypothetical protein [Solirubrobacter soli]